MTKDKDPKDIHIAELQTNCKKFRDEAITLRTAPAILAHVLRRCMEQIGTSSHLYKDCVVALSYSQSDGGVDHGN